MFPLSFLFARLNTLMFLVVPHMAYFPHPSLCFIYPYVLGIQLCSD